MQKLKRVGSKLGLYRKDNDLKASSFRPSLALIEDEEEQGWPLYNPADYKERETLYVSFEFEASITLALAMA
jgi:hypothetical protein